MSLTITTLLTTALPPEPGRAVTRLEGRTLEGVDVTGPALETVWWFERGLALRTFPIFTRDFEHWLLYLPNGDVLTQAPARTGPSSRATNLVLLNRSRLASRRVQ